MLKLKISVKYLKLWEKLKLFNEESLLKAAKVVFNDYLGASIKRRLVRRVNKKFNKDLAAEMNNSIREGQWKIRTRAGKLFTQLIMKSDIVKVMDEGGEIKSKVPDGFIAIPKKEFRKADGTAIAKLKRALIPGTKEWKNTFVRMYGDYGIIFDRKEANKRRDNDYNRKGGIYILRKSVKVSPQQFINDVMSSAEEELAKKIEEVLTRGFY